MKAIKAKLKDAQKIKQYLIKKSIYNNQYKLKIQGESIFLPIKEGDGLEKRFKGTKLCDEPLELQEKTRGFKEKINSILDEKEKEHFSGAFDTVGQIAILEIDDELRKKEKEIAKLLLKTNPHIKTVLAKDSMHEGEFRTQKMRHLAGIDTKEATYRENGVVMKVNLEEVYFTPRLSEERKRIIPLVRPGEMALVMFSGAAPYPLIIAKNTKAKEVWGIEINPVGHKYGIENVKLNKLEKRIKLFLGDVKSVIPELLKQNPKLKFDRILMPLPRDAQDFLYEAILVSKPGTIIHFYNFVEEEGFPDNVVSIIDRFCKAVGVSYKVLRAVKCGQYSPRKYRVCVDFQVI